MTTPTRLGLTGRSLKPLLDPHPNRQGFSNLQPQLATALLRINLARLKGRADLEAAAETELTHALEVAGKSTLKFDATFYADRERA